MAKRRGSKRENDLSSLVARHVDELVSALTVELRAQVAREIQAYFGTTGRPGARTAGARVAGRARGRRILPCIAPGCRNPSKGPRFHFLCDTHRDAPKKDYTAWQAAKRQKAGA